MTCPGTISLRIDLNIAKDKKICDLIPFVRLERLEFNDSPPLPDGNLAPNKKDSTTWLSSPPPVKRSQQKLNSIKFQIDHCQDDSENFMAQASTSLPSIRRSGRRSQQSKSCNLQSSHPDNNQTVAKSNPTKQTLSPQRKIERIDHDSKVSDKRPYKCNLCSERFHTRVLQAVHMRIHEESDEDAEDEEAVDDVQAFSESELKSDGTCARTVPFLSIATNLSKSTDNENSLSSVTDHLLVDDKNTNSNSSPFSTTDEDSVSSLVSNSGLPGPKSKKIKRRGPIKLLKCKECPASFSQQWYLDLHLILLHYVHKKNSSIKCPGCYSIFINEEHVRQHVQTVHSKDLFIMSNEISSALGLTTDALTGEHIKHKKKGSNPGFNNLENCYHDKQPFHSQMPENTPSDWRKASAFEKDRINDLIEAELKYIAIERNKMGDHFSYTHIQRLSLEICEYLKILNFFDNSPPKRWAQRVLIKVRQIPRPGRFRFVHNVNASYLNAVSELSHRGLSENKIFYAFEARICDVKKDGTARRVPKTPIGSTSPDVSVEDTICTVISTNANGSVLLHPTIIFRGQIADVKSLHKLKALEISHPSKDFLENAYFDEWFAQFLLAIPPARPVLLLVEGTVSQLSFRIIMLARENDVHILFVPSRKRFVHSHQLIRESLMVPLMREFDKAVVEHLETNDFSSLRVKDFSKVFGPAWKKALCGAEVRKSFIQSGFLPLPNSTEPLEVAARDYLDEVIAVGKGSKSSTDVSGSAMPTNNLKVKSTPDTSSSPSCNDLPRITTEVSTPTPAVAKIKTEPIDYDAHDLYPPVQENIKQEPQESILGVSSEEIKQEVVDLPNSSQTEAQFDIKFDSEELECPGCSKFFSSSSDLSAHECSLESSNVSRENSIRQSASDECHYHSCPHCMMSFASKESLTFHINSYHTFKRNALGKTTSLETTAIALKNVSLPGTSQKRKSALAGPKSSSKRSKVVSFSASIPTFASDSESESSSSESSRTLTASPINEHDYSLNTALAEYSVNDGRRRQIPPPPLPEHDYLGQIYKKTMRRKSATKPIKLVHQTTSAELAQNKTAKLAFQAQKSPYIIKLPVNKDNFPFANALASPVQKVLYVMKAQANKNVSTSANTLGKKGKKRSELKRVK